MSKTEKKRIIPEVPKEDRTSFNEGVHEIPNWLLTIFGITLIIFFATIIIF